MTAPSAPSRHGKRHPDKRVRQVYALRAEFEQMDAAAKAAKKSWNQWMLELARAALTR